MALTVDLEFDRGRRSTYSKSLSDTPLPGGIGEFSGEAADWESYIERLENYFVAHEITQ